MLDGMSMKGKVLIQLTKEMRHQRWHCGKGKTPKIGLCSLLEDEREHIFRGQDGSSFIEDISIFYMQNFK